MTEPESVVFSLYQKHGWRKIVRKNNFRIQEFERKVVRKENCLKSIFFTVNRWLLLSNKLVEKTVYKIKFLRRAIGLFKFRRMSRLLCVVSILVSNYTCQIYNPYV